MLAWTWHAKRSNRRSSRHAMYLLQQCSWVLNLSPPFHFPLSPPFTFSLPSVYRHSLLRHLPLLPASTRYSPLRASPNTQKQHYNYTDTLSHLVLSIPIRSFHPCPIYRHGTPNSKRKRSKVWWVNVCAVALWRQVESMENRNRRVVLSMQGDG